MSNQPEPKALAPLPYHREMVGYLRVHEQKLWEWYSEKKLDGARADEMRLELLKSTVRLERGSHANLYEIAESAQKVLGIDVQTTFYQAQGDLRVNASLCSVPGECHIVLQGAVLRWLDAVEMSALIGHELGHYRFIYASDPDVRTAGRILHAIAADPRAEPSHVLSAQRFDQYTEIFADRGAWLICQDVQAVVRCLVRIETSLEKIDAAAYIAQADEIFNSSTVTTTGITHPESFIRARAISRWDADPEQAESEIRRMIEGAATVERLDLLAQQRLSKQTHDFLKLLLEPKWFQTETTLAHARHFFFDFNPARSERKIADFEAIPIDYLCYLMLDFATVDESLDQLPLARAFEIGEPLNLCDRLEELAAKELRTSRKTLAKIRADKNELLARAAEQSEKTA